MAKILYALASEGLGHVFRSKAIIDHLKKKHNLKIITGGRSFKILSNETKSIHKIGTYKIIYKDNEVALIRTLFLFFLSSIYYLFYNLKIVYIMKKFEPDVLICDFEPYSNYIAAILKIPCISIDNQQTLIRTDVDKLDNSPFSDFFGKLTMKLFILKADHYLCTTFFYPRINKINTQLFPPIIRKEILAAISKDKGHILVYQTSSSNHYLFEILKKINKKFIIYGFDLTKGDGNLIFKGLDNHDFYKDLCGCSALITNGGFTLISEALNLKKPILSIPVKGQIEQIYNAHYLDKLGYGKYLEEASSKGISNFINKLNKYKYNLRSYKKSDNKEIFRFIDKVIKRY